MSEPKPTPARPTAARVRVRVDGEEHETDALSLDEDLRRGLLPAAAEVQSPQLTDGAWRTAAELPALAEALDAPGARLAARFREAPLPWLTAVVALALTLIAVAQQASGWPTGDLHRSLYAVAAGQGPTLLAGRWWTVLSFNVVHAPEAELSHLISNLTIIGYCAMRVERAVGPAGLLRTLLFAAAGSGGLVGLASEVPAVGSSGLAFGLWGAQIAFGFREGDSIPQRFRRFYGYGNLVIFVPLYVSGLGVEGVSDLGHLGGLLGGALSVLVGQPATCAPAAQVRTAALRQIAGGAGALAASAALVPLLGAWGGAPVVGALLGGRHPVPLADQGITMPLPDRMWPADVGAMRDDIPADAGVGVDAQLAWDLYRIDEPEGLAAIDPVRAFVPSRRRDRGARPAPAPAPLHPSFQSEAWLLEGDEDGAEQALLIVHTMRQGPMITMVAERYGGDLTARPGTGVGALFAGAVAGLDVQEPASLLVAKEAYDRSPNDRVLTYRYAMELAERGRWSEADALLGTLSAGEDGVAWDAVRSRLWVWRMARGLDGLALDEGPPTTWLRPFLDTPVVDLSIHQHGVLWLIQRGDCPTAQAHITALAPQVAAWAEAYPQRTDDIAALQQALATVTAAAAARCPAADGDAGALDGAAPPP